MYKIDQNTQKFEFINIFINLAETNLLIYFENYYFVEPPR